MSNQEDVCELFKEILNDAKARLELSGLEQSSFSYDLPEDGLAPISGYLHTNNRFLLTDAAVRGWIFDDRIIEEIVWTPIHPGKNGDWKQHSLIKSIFAACDGGTRRLEEWVGNSSHKIDRGGRPRTQPANRGQAGMDGSEADSGGGTLRPRGRLPRPPPVDTDTLVQAAVRSRLRSMSVAAVSEICTIVFPDQKSRRRQPKEAHVDKLMTNPDKLALLAAALDIEADSPDPLAAVPSEDCTVQLSTLRGRLRQREAASAAAAAAAAALRNDGLEPADPAARSGPPPPHAAPTPAAPAATTAAAAPSPPKAALAPSVAVPVSAAAAAAAAPH
jgi:hypothetical protein